MCKYINIFSNNPGCTDLAEHDIELRSDRPIVAKPCRLSLRQIDILIIEIFNFEIVHRGGKEHRNGDSLGPILKTFSYNSVCYYLSHKKKKNTCIYMH